MTNKKSKFLTFFISLIPGAGEMYLGFYKMGISLMALFALLASFSGLLNSGLLILFLPVIWFYSFFHVHNLNSMPDEEFYALEDDWLFHLDNTASLQAFLSSHRKFLSWILIFIGAAELWQIFTSFLHRTLNLFSIPDEVYFYLNNITSDVPQILISLALIYVGVMMIKQKKETLNQTAAAEAAADEAAAAKEALALIPAPPYASEEKDAEKEENA